MGWSLGSAGLGPAGRKRPNPKPTWTFLKATLWAGPNVALKGSRPGHLRSLLQPRGGDGPEWEAAFFPGREGNLRGEIWGISVAVAFFFFFELCPGPASSRAASRRLGEQPHGPALACPALSRIPNPSHMVSISLGSAGACSAVSELTFPCLSMRLLARAARPSRAPGPPRAAPSDTGPPPGPGSSPGFSRRSGDLPLGKGFLLLGCSYRLARGGNSPKMWLFHPKVLCAVSREGFGLGAGQGWGVGAHPFASPCRWPSLPTSPRSPNCPAWLL